MLVFSCTWGLEDQAASPRKYNKKAVILGNCQISDNIEVEKIPQDCENLYR